MVNPPRGFLVTANNRIVDDDYPHHITSEWMAGYRAQRIEEMLGERERHSVTDFERMQLDFVSLPGIETVHRLSRLHPVRQRETRAIERLKSWDGVLSPDSVAATDRARLHGRVRAGDRARGGAGPGGGGALDEPLRTARSSRSSLRRGGSRSGCWSCGTRTTRPGSPRRSSRRDAAGTTLRWRLSRRRSTASRSGSATTRTSWRWGRVHPAEFMHPFGAANPVFRRIFNRKRGGRRGQRDRDPDRLPADGALQGACGGRCTGWWPTSATLRARGGS